MNASRQPGSAGAGAVRGRWVARRELSEAERDAMFELMDRHFLGVTREVFDADLEAKDHVVLLADGERLCGFTTFAVTRREHRGKALWVVSSGDTIVERAAWGSFALAASWIDAVHRVRQDLGDVRLVWLLICSGIRTYRFLPVFFRDYHPFPGRETPPSQRRLLDHLAALQYGDAYDPGTGVVRLPHPQPLRPELLVDPQDSADPHARFFLERNPGHARGDELACLTELSDDNLTAAGRRMVRAGRRARDADREAEERPG